MNNTIFDDVFRTMIEKMPYLAVPLINEVFHTSYSENVPIVQLRNEHQHGPNEVPEYPGTMLFLKNIWPVPYRPHADK